MHFSFVLWKELRCEMVKSFLALLERNEIRA